MQDIKVDRLRGSGGKATKSESVCAVPMFGCLLASEAFLGKNRVWRTQNADQRILVELLDGHRHHVAKLPELESIAAYDVAAVNAFIAKRDFRIALPPSQPPDFNVASVMKVKVEWQIRGQVTEIGKFPAVRLERGCEFFTSIECPHPVVGITTKNGDRVFMTVSDEEAPSGFTLFNRVRSIEETLRQTKGYKGAIFPMIQYDEEVDISWVTGLATTGEDGAVAIIKHALQQTKFRMNDVGAIVESAVAMGVLRSVVMERPLIIDRPFLLWLSRPSMPQLPLFAGWFNEDDWKNPGAL